MLRTAEAEGVAAGAAYRGDDGLELLVRDMAFDRIFAIGGWTPSQNRRIVDVGAVEEGHVPERGVRADETRGRRQFKVFF